MRVCIIGAGFAGLNAASVLERAGHDVLVLEARARVGGRVWSRTLPNGAVVEMGAEFVEPEHTELLAVMQRLGLALQPMGMTYGDREPRGGIGVERATLLDGYARLNAAFAERTPDPDESLAAFMDRVELDPGAREAIQSRIEISATVSADRLAADVMGRGGYQLSTHDSQEVSGGNQQIALALQRELGDAVRLALPVEAIDWDDAGARVHADGTSWECERVVLAVPARLLERIAIRPALPEAQVRAIAAVDYGHAAKLFVPLRERPTGSAVMSVPDTWWSWTARGADGAFQPVVSCFMGTARSLADLAVADGPAGWLAALTTLRPDLAPLLDPAGALLSTWDDDPWIGAAYSVTLAGNPRDSELLAAPVGPLHFAGEHTAGAFSSTMEGALRSGRRAAEEIIRG